MNKTEILNIVNEPSKHIQIVKIDGKDSIVYSSKFIELLELIPTMYTKDDMIGILKEIRDEASNIRSTIWNCASFTEGIREYDKLIQQKINSLKS